jgi:hypothetical protein
VHAAVALVAEAELKIVVNAAPKHCATQNRAGLRRNLEDVAGKRRSAELGRPVQIACLVTN